MAPIALMAAAAALSSAAALTAAPAAAVLPAALGTAGSAAGPLPLRTLIAVLASARTLALRTLLAVLGFVAAAILAAVPLRKAHGPDMEQRNADNFLAGYKQQRIVADFHDEAGHFLRSALVDLHEMLGQPAEHVIEAVRHDITGMPAFGAADRLRSLAFRDALDVRRIDIDDTVFRQKHDVIGMHGDQPSDHRFRTAPVDLDGLADERQQVAYMLPAVTEHRIKHSYPSIFKLVNEWMPDCNVTAIPPLSRLVRTSLLSLSHACRHEG